MQTAIVTLFIITLIFIYIIRYKQVEKNVRKFMNDELQAIFDETISKINAERNKFYEEINKAKILFANEKDEFRDLKDSTIESAKKEVIEKLYPAMDKYITTKYTSKQNKRKIYAFINAFKETFTV